MGENSRPQTLSKTAAVKAAAQTDPHPKLGPTTIMEGHENTLMEKITQEWA